ncbi:DUF6817 domain-containing protein [Streptomyces barringtoniae]|uniref:DUF6817 domain-containing protein n=1 Tax=Streptomyces barringtoniae TaxID=2892029 RepID=UPI001E5366FC|nr:hypothetical protein [Streptomyces barringtoniae]MCC5479820.1 hypothetical protein [Streptomyces barringtoniae]
MLPARFWQLADGGARPALRLAVLWHACYGTDGCPDALLPPDRRAELAAVIGTEAEAPGYLHGFCGRKATYRALAEDDGGFQDRFTCRSHVPEAGPRRDFAELTAANELDLARLDPAFRSRRGSSASSPASAP